MLGVAVRHVKVNPDTLTPEIRDLRRACDSNTIMLLASAPQVLNKVLLFAELKKKTISHCNIVIYIKMRKLYNRDNRHLLS